MKSTIAAIDFGTSKIVTLVAEDNGNRRCDIIGAGTAPYEGFLDGEWNDTANLRKDGLRRYIIEEKLHSENDILDAALNMDERDVPVAAADVGETSDVAAVAESKAAYGKDTKPSVLAQLKEKAEQAAEYRSSPIRPVEVAL